MTRYVPTLLTVRLRVKRTAGWTQTYGNGTFYSIIQTTDGGYALAGTGDNINFIKTDSEGNKEKNYYTSESVGIATGILITALHQLGLATLTHTPSPMKFLNQILDRPENEKPYLVLVVGYPAKNTKVPNITRKSINEISDFIE